MQPPSLARQRGVAWEASPLGMLTARSSEAQPDRSAPVGVRRAGGAGGMAGGRAGGRAGAGAGVTPTGPARVSHGEKCILDPVKGYRQLFLAVSQCGLLAPPAGVASRPPVPLK